MSKLPEVSVRILKMCESSGNEQFFVRLVRNDATNGKLAHYGILEHSCWQTKHLDKDTCLDRAWFDASYLARFVGLSTMDEVEIVGLSEEEKEKMKKAVTHRLG